MQEKTGAQLLKDTADYIEANGMLFGAWENGDDTPTPCYCLFATLRTMAGLPATPPKKGGTVLDGVPEDALLALGAQIEPECIALGRERDGEDSPPLTVMEWADHYADVLKVRVGRRYGSMEWQRRDFPDGDRGHVVRVLRQAAGRCES